VDHSQVRQIADIKPSAAVRVVKAIKEIGDVVPFSGPNRAVACLLARFYHVCRLAPLP
jgi:hypothetical protein